MSLIVNLAPVFLMIFAGFALRRFGIVPDTFWPSAEHLTFYVFFPALLLSNTAGADLAGVDVGGMGGAILGAILAVTVLCLLLRTPLRLDGATFTSLLQGAIRPNVYVVMATGFAFAGEPGLAAVSLCVALAVPVVNVISVIVLVRFGTAQGKGSGLRAVALSVVRNPLILACVAGLLLNVLGLGLPPVIGPMLELLGRASLPLGLLAVGAGLNFQAVRWAGRAVMVTAALKLVILPAMTFALCLALQVEGVPMFAAVMFSAVPISASAYVMARQMGGNAPVLAGAITATTIVAAVTMPAIAALLS